MFPIYYLSYNFIRKYSFITFFSAYKNIPCNYLTIKLLAIFEAVGPFLISPSFSSSWFINYFSLY